ncbi:MAG: serine hydrolase [Chloroflexi bacterium]|nr:serine hydrolase [Chloroflexota bacterium]
MSQQQSVVGESPAQHETRLRYLPGLDGVRALAVIAVLLYHADLPIAGGFLGVETFFVLSGYLITALLLVEWNQHSRIDLRAFWLRRARRLLPALFVMLLGTLLIAALFLRGERTGLGADILAALGYVMNWRLIASGQAYFDPLVRPSLLQHLWSLAVEEQFYLLWPLIFFAGMRLLRKKGFLALTLIAAISSTALMAWLYQPGGDPSRIYYGTDTRASGVLFGAALALIWTPTGTTSERGRRLAWLLDGAGLLALTVLIACFVWVSDRSAWLYRGGFTLIDLLTIVVIAALTHPSARIMPRLLGVLPLRWVGLRSYGLYLWHWPIFMVTRPLVDLPLDVLPALGLRLAIVIVLVELSYRYVEMPIRHGAAGRVISHWWQTQGTQLLGSRFWVLGSPHRAAVSVRWLALVVPLLLLVLGAASSDRVTPKTAAQRAAPPTDTSIIYPSFASVPTRTPPVMTPQATIVASGAIAVPDTGAAPEAASVPEAPAAPAAPNATPPPATQPTAVPQPLDPALVAQLQIVLDEAIARGDSPGAVLSVHIPGYLPWSGASGIADQSDGRRMQPETLIHASSITKMFTAVIVLQLVEEGKLDLDSPIGTWLPEITPLAGRTTVRHLMSHTSGVFDYLEDSRFFVEAYGNPDRVYTPDELVAMVDQYGAAFEPGTEGAWKYASTNYVILGMLVEQVTGRPLAEEMRQRIFEPLGLERTVFATTEEFGTDMAHGYIGASGRSDVSMTFVFATGNIISSADDLAVFIDGLFTGRLLSQESLTAMTTTIYTGGAYDMPELEYGLGIMRANLSVGPGPNGEPRPDNVSTVFGHIGGIAGFRSAVWRVPESQITIALGQNQAVVDPNVLARDALEVILAWQDQ